MDAQPLSTPGMVGHSSESTAGSSGASTPAQQNQQSTSATSENDIQKIQLLAPQESDTVGKPYSVQDPGQVEAQPQPPDNVIESVQDSVQVEGGTPQSQPPDDTIENVTTETVTVMFDQEPIEISSPEVEASVLSTETPDERRSPQAPSAGWQQIPLQPPAYSHSVLNPQLPTYSQSAMNPQPPTHSLNPQPPTYSQSAPNPLNPQPSTYSQSRSALNPQPPPTQHVLVESSHGHPATIVVQRQPQHIHVNRRRRVPPSSARSYPNDYLVLSLFATFCCCLCLGIPAILFATRVKPLYEQGDYEGAKQASQCAAGFSVASIVSGIITVIVIISARVVTG